jgi:lysozyme
MDIYDQLRRDEGLQLFPYLDTVGKTTIGIGRNLTDKGITAEEAEMLLGNDVEAIQNALGAKLPWFRGLSDARQGALINIGFNVGVVGLLGFTKTLDFMSQSNWDAAADEILNSKWASQVGDRAKRISNQIRTGAWT